jgi:sensor histidine kinase YesM
MPCPFLRRGCFVDENRLSGDDRRKEQEKTGTTHYFSKGMQQYPFIFSAERRYRIRRHFVFWFSWWLFQAFLYSFTPASLDADYFDRLPVSMVESLFFLVPHVFLSYSLMYYVVPTLILKGRYLRSVFTVLGLFLVTGSISSLIGIYITGPYKMSLNKGFPIPIHVQEMHFFLGLLAGLRGAITIGGLAAAIKLMKHLYQKDQRNLQLEKENISSQLLLLKAQVHPHFLFNTLNNIYASTQETSPRAAGMIMSLSELLRHILYECDKPLVSLEQELQMLRQYIHLEEARYGNSLDVDIELPSQPTSDLYIAPLLLLPFIENCFKHGTSGVIEQPWISLRVETEDNELRMKLVNGKAHGHENIAPGIGLRNVKERLQLLYPGRHKLQYHSEPEVFIVNLKLQLERVRLSKKEKPSTTEYA